jgi:[ribosomal protein S18]-alanine N-acetyltransferase
MMSIRRALTDDLPSILRIETQAFGSAAWDREQFLDYFARPDRSVLLVAVIGNDVVGYALAWHSEMRAEIHSVAVAPAHRGKGIAVGLLKRVIRVLLRRGIGTTDLNVRRDNAAAIGLYRKLGFQTVRRINGYYEDGAPAWRMRWSG